MPGTDLLWRVGQDIIGAALSGAGEVELVAVLGASLSVAGLGIRTIEVACDAVDPERADHFIRGTMALVRKLAASGQRNTTASRVSPGSRRRWIGAQGAIEAGRPSSSFAGR